MGRFECQEEEEGLVDYHLHLSLGFLPPLAEQDYAARMSSDLARLVQAQQREQLWALQEPLVQTILPLMGKVSLHVQSVSYLDSYFNWALLTHPRLKPFLNHSLFLYLGLHPWFIAQDAQAAQDEVEQLCELIAKVSQDQNLSSPVLLQDGFGSAPGSVSLNNNKCKDAYCISGLGEIGLDKGAKASLEVQESCLQRLLQANQSWGLPCSCHCVKAHNELLALLKAYSQPSSSFSSLSSNSVGGMVHGSGESDSGICHDAGNIAGRGDVLEIDREESPAAGNHAGQDSSHEVSHKIVCGAGIIHGFNSSFPIAQRYLSLNFKLGLGLRWLNPKLLPKLRELITSFPDGYCLETDTDHIPYKLEPLQRLTSYLQTVRQA